MSPQEDASNIDPHLQLAELRARFAAVVEASDDALIGRDLNGSVTAWNPAAVRMFGIAADEILGRLIDPIIPSPRVAEEASLFERVRGGEKIVHYETERQQLDGTLVPVLLSLSPLHDEQGKIIGTSEIARDLTIIRKVHRELKHREALFHAILEAAPDGLIVIDKRGLIQSFSSAAEQMFGFESREVIGQNVSLLMPQPHASGHDGHLERYLATGERHIIGIGRVVTGRRKDGHVFPVELTVGEVNLSAQRLFAGFVRDLTDQQERERRINELQSELVHVCRVAELGQMVSALAHEVNQPLTAMASYLSGVRRLLLTEGHEQAIQQALQLASEQGDRARQIIQRIRDQVSKRGTKKQEEDILSTIEEASGLALAGIDKGLKMEISVDEGARQVIIDKIQIEQVLINLIRNSAEAMAASARREICIKAARLRDVVQVSVFDTGPGLPDMVRSKLFQPFITTKQAGLGVGLSVCQTIIESHGGTLWAEDGPECGTIFCFTLPAVSVNS